MQNLRLCHNRDLPFNKVNDWAIYILSIVMIYYFLGDESGEMTSLLLNNSTCDICPKADGSDMKFKSSYHFHKHIRSRAHMDRILQQSQIGQSIPEHLLPPSLMTQDQNIEVEETSDMLVIAQESIQSE